VEFCPQGSVESYLRKNKSRLLEEENEEQKKLLLEQVLENLSQWTLQVADGMLHLSARKIIHGDLAIRNLLLLNEQTVKITDFGLARQLQNYTIYKKTQQVSLFLSIYVSKELPMSTTVILFNTFISNLYLGVTCLPKVYLQWSSRRNPMSGRLASQSGKCFPLEKFHIQDYNGQWSLQLFWKLVYV